tara:strand:- start:187 stop:810 length:624 start_codon:yes stop_codon:yes gene_type:complete
MVFNPIYSNALPYGDATPNRSGVYLKVRMNNKSKVFLGKINAGFFKEVIGQGTAEKRSFGLVKAALKVNLHHWLDWKKELSFSASSESELTSRGGDAVSSINLFSHQVNASLNMELAKKFFIQTSYKQFNANGNEFLTERDNYGDITYFTLTQVKQKDHMLSVGILYKIRENVYANLQYNWWGMTFTNQPFSDYKYNRLLFILSVTL